MTFRIHTDSTFVRPELHFDVRNVPDEDPWTLGTVTERHPRRWDLLLETLRTTLRPAIVYAMSRRDCDELASAIRTHLGEHCVPYHAGLEPGERRDRERAFISGAVDLIVATSAFGMGIDKPDVRTVVHWTVPPSPEALYQEAGRAGRGRTGQPANAILLFNDSDLDRAYRIIRRDAPTAAEVARADLVLRELADHGGSATVTVADTDLARLAMLRTGVQPRVVLAHLERAGLVRELDRFAGAFRAWVVDFDDPHVTDLQRRLLSLLSPTTGSQAIVVRDLVEQLIVDDDAADEAGVRTALKDLERRGVLRRQREVSVALLRPPDVATAEVHACRRAALSVWRLLEEHRERIGPRRYLRDVGSRVGDATAVATAIEVLSAHGLVETAWSDEGRSSVPGLRLSRNQRTDALRRAFEAASSLCGLLQVERSRYELEHLAAKAGSPVQQVLDGLAVLHLVGAASVDMEGWSAESSATARKMLVCEVDDRDDRLQVAERLAAQRAREQRLRLEVLRRYAALDADDDSTLDVHQAYLHRYLSEPGFLDGVAGETAEDALVLLNEKQRDVVVAPVDEPLVVVAGPGTGKTRTVVHRIAYRVRSSVVLPERILAATFSRAATEELRVRLAQLGVRGVHVRTLHSLAVAIVGDHWSNLGFSERPVPLMEGQARQRLLRNLGASNPRDELAEIDVARAELRTPKCAPLAEQYDEILRTRNEFDLGQALVFAADVLSDPTRGRHYLDRWDEILVDEFQDLSPAQIQLVDRLTGSGFDRHLQAHLTIVGDPRQAIFEWNGAKPDALLRRSNEAATIALVDNYRSNPAIIALANTMIRQVLPNLSAIRATQDSAAEQTLWCSPHKDSASMTDHVVRQVGGWLAAGIPDDEVAVLAYRGATVSAIGRALRSAGIASHEVGLAALPETEVFRRMQRLLTTLPAEGGDRPAMATFDRLLTVALADSQADSDLDDGERLRAEVLEHRPHQASDLRDVFERIRRGDEGPRSTAGVTVTTLHKAKGLEWEAVAVTDVGRSGLDGGTDPERCRLLYVGVTRARRLLDISWAGTPSRWMPKGAR